MPADELVAGEDSSKILIQRRAYGFRNFKHFRLRVIAQRGQ